MKISYNKMTPRPSPPSGQGGYASIKLELIISGKRKKEKNKDLNISENFYVFDDNAIL